MDLARLRERRRFLLHVKTGARTTELLSHNEEGDFYTLAVAAAPVDGKANAEIERFFTKLLKRKATIKGGHTGKKKLIELE